MLLFNPYNLLPPWKKGEYIHLCVWFLWFLICLMFVSAAAIYFPSDICRLKRYVACWATYFSPDLLPSFPSSYIFCVLLLLVTFIEILRWNASLVVCQPRQTFILPYRVFYKVIYMNCHFDWSILFRFPCTCVSFVSVFFFLQLFPNRILEWTEYSIFIPSREWFLFRCCFYFFMYAGRQK